jgi:carbamoyltransferase
MVILGIWDGINGGAALLRDGEIVAAINEERLNRKKMAVGFPWQSIREVMELSGVASPDIDFVAVAQNYLYFVSEPVPLKGWFSQDDRTKRYMQYLSSYAAPLLGSTYYSRNIYHKLKGILTRGRKKEIKTILKEQYNLLCPIEFVDHHYAHACSAYFTSDFENASVITMDGGGDGASSKAYRVENGKFTELTSIDSYNSLGNYYAYITYLCGFTPQKHEGKITGLAAYGEPIYADLLKTLISYQDGKILNSGNVYYWSAIKKIRKLLPKDFKKEALAASMQQVLEDIAAEYIRYYIKKSGFKNVALAGGVFANVKLNQRIHELEEVESLFIHPGMTDGGLAVGAAYALHAEMDPSSSVPPGEKFKLKNVYFGPEHTDKEIEDVLVNHGLDFEYVKEIEPVVARLLADGKVVARFTGKMEYGPRALGNRSILYQPNEPTVNDWLNKKLNRTEFMPFAPATLAEHADKCYKDVKGAENTARFMTITFDCTDWMKETCKGVVHLDGTARPQLVDKTANPGYYGIIKGFMELTGLPSIINTSFNMHEEPIVCSPYDAVRAFMMGKLDYLAIGNFLVKNKAE